ncbi:MAG: hypothetical protein HY720_08655 [Planctomycetes bacterium]|nr:hypothetical protein [Planctomycetota bacterium]
MKSSTRDSPVFLVTYVFEGELPHGGRRRFVSAEQLDTLQAENPGIQILERIPAEQFTLPSYWFCVVPARDWKPGDIASAPFAIDSTERVAALARSGETVWVRAGPFRTEAEARREADEEVKYWSDPNRQH